MPPFVERAGRRRFNFWPHLLLFCSTIGFLVNGGNLAIALAQRLWHGTSPHGGMFALSIQERQMFLWMVFSIVGPLAALNLGSHEVAGIGGAQAARTITARRVVLVFLTMMGLVAVGAGTWLFADWMTVASATTLTSITRVAKWVGICAAYFQRTISQVEWVGEMEKVRRPLGIVRSRKLSSTKFSPGWTRFGSMFTFATSFDGSKVTVVHAFRSPSLSRYGTG